MTAFSAPVLPPADPLPWLRRAALGRLANGMEVCLLPNRQAELVTTALFYRAGARDEPPGHAGLAHFHVRFDGKGHEADGRELLHSVDSP